MSAPNPTKLDAGQVLQGAFNEVTGKLRTEATVSLGDLDMLVDFEPATSGVHIGDKDNVLGLGAGAVLDEFISEYYVPQDGNLEVRLDYPARIMAGLYLRLKYTSTHSSGCTVKCNLYLHWKAS